jgi:hypothetical protein
MPAKATRVCEWLTEAQAFAEFARASGTIIQAQGHIKPLHWYVACRLVVEGGFLPDDLTPRPPFEVVKTGNHYRLIYRPDLATSTEATVFGGMKSKNIDVVASMRGIGAVFAISCKGTVGAYRNLTNRMEEAIGDCTNIHAAYPALVYGFISLIKANTGPLAAGNDIAIDSSGTVVTAIRRYHLALANLSGRKWLRDDPSAYEAAALVMVDMADPSQGIVYDKFPDAGSTAHVSAFFRTLYTRYDERFVYNAPDMLSVTARRQWDSDSPALKDFNSTSYGYEAREAD